MCTGQQHQTDARDGERHVRLGFFVSGEEGEDEKRGGIDVVKDGLKVGGTLVDLGRIPRRSWLRYRARGRRLAQEGNWWFGRLVQRALKLRAVAD